MVQIIQQSVYGVENPRPRNFLGRVIRARTLSLFISHLLSLTHTHKNTRTHTSVKRVVTQFVWQSYIESSSLVSLALPHTYTHPLYLSRTCTHTYRYRIHSDSVRVRVQHRISVADAFARSLSHTHTYTHTLANTLAYTHTGVGYTVTQFVWGSYI